MSKLIKIISFWFLMGAMFGVLVGISIHYPLKRESIDKIQNVCAEHQDWDKIKLKITGNISTVTCKDGTIFEITTQP